MLKTEWMKNCSNKEDETWCIGHFYETDGSLEELIVLESDIRLKIMHGGIVGKLIEMCVVLIVKDHVS